MKSFKILLLLFIWSSACIVYAQTKWPWDEPVKPGAWDYPVKPGTDEWKQFKKTEEMRKSCQIPEEMLRSISTNDLTDLCLRYPLLFDLFAFENTNFGLDVLFKTFNGIRELYQRKDITSNLTKRYLEKVKNFSFMQGTNSDIEKGIFKLTISTLEVLMSRIEWQNIEGEENPKEVLKSLFEGYVEKIKLPEYFKGSGFQTNFYARAHIIVKIDSSFIEQLPEKEKNNALYSGRISDEKTINLIDMYSYQLIK